MLVSEKNRLGTAISAVRPRIEAHIVWLFQTRVAYLPELGTLDRRQVAALVGVAFQQPASADE